MVDMLAEDHSQQGLKEKDQLPELITLTGENAPSVVAQLEKILVDKQCNVVRLGVPDTDPVLDYGSTVIGVEMDNASESPQINLVTRSETNDHVHPLAKEGDQVRVVEGIGLVAIQKPTPKEGKVETMLVFIPKS